MRLFFLISVLFTLVVFAKHDTWADELHTSVIQYEPGVGREAQCVLTNVGNRTVVVSVQINTPLSPTAPITVILEPGEYSFVVTSIGGPFSTVAYCSFTFRGPASNIRGLIRMVDGVGTGGELVVLERAEAR